MPGSCVDGMLPACSKDKQKRRDIPLGPPSPSTCIDNDMSRFSSPRALLITLACFTLAASPALAQHTGMGMGAGKGPGMGTVMGFGAQAVGMISHVSPALLGSDLTEGYITQPALMTMGSALSGHFEWAGMLNLEGLTLERGQLNHSAWGEGYIDRRHPHTYLHEVVATGRMGAGAQGRFDGSVSLGRGFAPFGTDDPMVRGFVTYPSNHHLAQILERWVAIGAVKYGPAIVEYGRFNGNEPKGPSDVSGLGRFGDSWSARGTLLPVDGVEVQASVARVKSPEQPSGGGLDQHKRSYSVRFERELLGRNVYGLVEHERTADGRGSVEAFVFKSWLAEAAVDVSRFRIAARYEDSLRPEEERTQNLFRSVRPSTDNSILGTSNWRTWTAHLSSTFTTSHVSFEPFVEPSWTRARSTERFSIFQPKALYGDDSIWILSAGVRIAAGMQHDRMGRYGAARN